MGKCKACNIRVVDQKEYCPLCGNVLDLEDKLEAQGLGPDFNSYPNVYKRQRAIAVVMDILTFLWVAATIITVFLNYSWNWEFKWSFIVSAGLLYPLWMVFMIVKERGYLHRIFFGVIGASLLVCLIDGVTGFHGWSVNFVLPGALILVDIVLLVLMFVNHRNWHSYMVFQLLTIIIGLIPLMLIRLHIVRYPLFSEWAFISCVLVFLGTLILGGAQARMELHRRFHI